MRVAVYETWQDQRAFCVDGLFREDRTVWHARKALADGHNGVALDDYVSVFDHAAVYIHGDHGPASDQKIDKIGGLGLRRLLRGTFRRTEAEHRRTDKNDGISTFCDSLW